MKRGAIAIALGIAAVGCSRHEARENGVPVVHQDRETPLRPLPRARPTIDPRSNEAAEELVEGFVRLLNAGRLNDAYMLLGASAPSRSQFDDEFKRFSDLHASSGAAGLQEGAAGSIYVSVPMTISGTANNERVSRSAAAVLRRVNDVPGSSEEQRRWHIERIDWKND